MPAPTRFICEAHYARDPEMREDRLIPVVVVR